MPAEYEACMINEVMVAEICANYEVEGKTLLNRLGWYFVGEVGVGWWYIILTPDKFEKVFEWDHDETGFLAPVHRRTTVSFFSPKK